MEVAEQLKRIDAKLTHLINRPAKQTWVSVGIIQTLTGWDGKAVDKARKNGLVQFKKNSNGGYLYHLESLPEMFIVNKSI